MCELGSKVAIWGIRRTGLPPEDSPLFHRASNRQLCVFSIVWIDFFKESFPKLEDLNSDIKFEKELDKNTATLDKKI